MEKRPSLGEEMSSRGSSRREFLRFCGYVSASLGLGAAGTTRLARALEKKPRPPVVWLHFQECTCCSESFIKSSHPLLADIVLDRISLEFSEVLQAAAGFQAEEALHQAMEKHRGG